MPKYLVQLQLFDFVLDPSLSCVKLPGVDPNREPVLIIDHNFSLHDQAPTEQNVKQIWTRRNIVDYLAYPILLLTDIAVHLFDEFRGPGFEKRHLLEVVKSASLLHVLYVEHLVMKILLLQHKTNCDSMGQKCSQAQLRLLQGAFTISFAFSKLNHALLKSVVNVDTGFAHHDHVQFFTEVTLFKDDLAFVIYFLVKLTADISQSFACVVSKERHIQLQVHSEEEVLS